MSVATSGPRHEMERALAEVVRGEPVVSGLWTTSDHEGLHFWLTVDPIDAEAERSLYELTDVLDQRFPDADFQLHVLNPRHYTVSVRDVVPAGAVEVPLRAT
ncbi:MAG: hypothetical protein M3N32_08880 [Actinomycetota bacterium]|nr:hypothetical protein [Actinomycetota bacterium]